LLLARRVFIDSNLTASLRVTSFAHGPSERRRLDCSSNRDNFISAEPIHRQTME